ncbi:hypothetical protein SPRG_04631 [Saprolegnia parasitica CBS 223.65]|uniref:Uncharacterized protein n=1 Tax=Saprolegnia parasitica (strain CBS 223.65) TaxID=695850 RepID=A0A067CND5_SAPPC|nr:hypothetical protein SPRG_04631 [Saprolegnia parasitica CBS 223.65]KDO30730.1 hypothetical protein SPRG_04631 [Saprolegnia parasitica CBS 223.65]|eukprot:XP_012198430.1 hypothetical protein SPRG_04631 [Saprolegnia parasitica CBS 223.65]
MPARGRSRLVNAPLQDAPLVRGSTSTRVWRVYSACASTQFATPAAMAPSKCKYKRSAAARSSANGERIVLAPGGASARHVCVVYALSHRPLSLLRPRRPVQGSVVCAQEARRCVCVPLLSILNSEQPRPARPPAGAFSRHLRLQDDGHPERAAALDVVAMLHDQPTYQELVAKYLHLLSVAARDLVP